jgi:hypothetical protein
MGLKRDKGREDKQLGGSGRLWQLWAVVAAMVVGRHPAEPLFVSASWGLGDCFLTQ